MSNLIFAAYRAIHEFLRVREYSGPLKPLLHNAPSPTPKPSASELPSPTKIVAETAVMLISLQMKMLQFDGQPLSGRATDVWSSGYVFGVFDYLQQTFGMSDLDECMHLNVVLFQGLFGGSVGSRMIDSYYENQMDLDAVEGALTGGNEVLRWRRDTNCIPMGWFLHVRGETKV